MTYCIKYYYYDYGDNDEYYCNVGERFRIREIDNEDDCYGLLLVGIGEPEDRGNLWFYFNRDMVDNKQYDTTIAFIWDYFRTKENRIKRIKEIAGGFK